ncbi:glycosyltransferase [Mangrovimonas sp. CR14]|uniref:glycosyltransferase family 2 protein n=1 Tax=Mangrovimonas sp. CR14 TaxID=2706120 RepID=UPI00141E15A9|nr:glycosyltransferase [Mangrovimonas sp. CR14]NIK91372.1 glycosyltransferase [Mangrovimonas sp. CR14]
MGSDVKNINISSEPINGEPVIMVSICCVTYNHEAYIKEALDGFLSQKVEFNYEVLINDDASTDKTPEILKAYEQKYPDIFKVIYQRENQYSKYKSGMNPRFNYPRAKGKYFAICDGDDYWTDPLKLQRQVSFLERNPQFAACSHKTQQVSDGNFEDDHRFGNIYNGSDVLTTEDLILNKVRIHSSSLLFRKEFLIEPEWLYKIKGLDIILRLLLSLKGPVKVLQESMSAYRLHVDGVSNSFNHQNYGKFLNMCTLYTNFNEYTKYKYAEPIKEAIKKEAKIHIVDYEINKFKEQFIKNKEYEYKYKYIDDLNYLDGITSFNAVLKLLFLKLKRKFSTKSND